MEHLKSPGKTLMKVAAWVFAIPVVLGIVFGLLLGNGGMGLQGWHIVLLGFFITPVALILFIVGLIMHMNFKSKIQLLQAQQQMGNGPRL